MNHSGVSVTKFVEDLVDRLHQRDRIVEALSKVDCAISSRDPEQVLSHLLKEREVVMGLLKQSGAVKQVGVEYIFRHLEWLVPKFLRPVSWEVVVNGKNKLRQPRSGK